jgi:hypothetical protein
VDIGRVSGVLANVPTGPRHYSRGADLRPKMRGVVAAFDREVNERRTKVVKPT